MKNLSIHYKKAANQVWKNRRIESKHEIIKLGMSYFRKMN
jgi:hypothetical protein